MEERTLSLGRRAGGVGVCGGRELGGAGAKLMRRWRRPRCEVGDLYASGSQGGFLRHAQLRDTEWGHLGDDSWRRIHRLVWLRG